MMFVISNLHNCMKKKKNNYNKDQLNAKIQSRNINLILNKTLRQNKCRKNMKNKQLL